MLRFESCSHAFLLKCRDRDAIIVINGTSPDLAHLVERGAITKVFRFPSRVSCVSGAALELACVGCEDGSIWSLERDQGSAGKVSDAKETLERLGEAGCELSVLSCAHNGVIAYVERRDPTRIKVQTADAGREGKKSKRRPSSSGASFALDGTITALLRLSVVSEGLLRVLCPTGVAMTSTSGLLLAGSATGTVYSLVTEAASVTPTRVSVFSCVDAVLFIGASLESVVVVWRSGRLTVVHESGVSRSLSLGVSVSSACCFGSLLALCPDSSQSPVIVLQLSGPSAELVPRRLDQLMPSCAAVLLLEDTSLVAIARSGVFCRRKLSEGLTGLPRYATATMSSFTSLRSNGNGNGNGDSVLALSSLWKEQEIARRRLEALNGSLSELSVALKVIQQKHKISCKLCPRIDVSGCPNLLIHVRNSTAFNMTPNHWTVLVAVSGAGKCQRCCVSLRRGLHIEATTAVFIPLQTFPCYSALTVSVWLVHSEAIATIDQSNLNNNNNNNNKSNVRFVDSQGAGLSMHLCTDVVSLLDFEWERDTTLQVLRSYVVPCPSNCLLRSGSSSLATSTAFRSFRLWLKAAVVKGLEMGSTETPFGSSVNWVTRPSNDADDVSEVLLTCSDGPEALAIRAAFLRKVLQLSKSTTTAASTANKKNEWKRTYKTEIAASLTKLSQAETVENLLVVYTEMRRWKFIW